MKIALGFDHGGVVYKEELISYLEKNGFDYEDFGTYSTESCDYPVYAEKVAKAVASGKFDRGILICGTGIGMSIAANKVKGIRASCANDIYSARMTRMHNDSNILTMGARVIGLSVMLEIVDTYLHTDYIGSYHKKRLDKIAELEENFGK